MDIMKFLIRSYDLIYLINGSTTKPPIFRKRRIPILFRRLALSDETSCGAIVSSPPTASSSGKGK